MLSFQRNVIRVLYGVLQWEIYVMLKTVYGAGSCGKSCVVVKNLLQVVKKTFVCCCLWATTYLYERTNILLGVRQDRECDFVFGV